MPPPAHATIVQVIPPHARRVLLYGGSFDPPTLAHTTLPPLVADAIDADVIAYLPALNPPHKPDQQLAAAHHRVAMLSLAVQDLPRACVLTTELHRPPTAASYTVDTLRELTSQTHAELRLLIGADQVRMFHTWREPEAVAAIAPPAVMIRPPDTRDSLLAALREADRPLWADRLVDVPRLDISATQARARIRAGLPTSDLLAPSVAAYIRQHRLYA